MHILLAHNTNYIYQKIMRIFKLNKKNSTEYEIILILVHSLYLYTPYQYKHSHQYNFLGVFSFLLRCLQQTHNACKTA